MFHDIVKKQSFLFKLFLYEKIVEMQGKKCENMKGVIIHKGCREKSVKFIKEVFGKCEYASM